MVVNEFLSWRRLRSSRVVHAGDTIKDLAPQPDPTARLAERDAMLRLVTEHRKAASAERPAP